MRNPSVCNTPGAPRGRAGGVSPLRAAGAGAVGGSRARHWRGGGGGGGGAGGSGARDGGRQRRPPPGANANNNTLRPTKEFRELPPGGGGSISPSNPHPLASQIRLWGVKTSRPPA
eukprot:9235090-Pyramimonas_sp.AAC.1